MTSPEIIVLDEIPENQIWVGQKDPKTGKYVVSIRYELQDDVAFKVEEENPD